MNRGPCGGSPAAGGAEKPFGPLPLWVGLTALAMAATVFFSSQTGDESGGVSRYVLRFLLSCAGITDLTAVPPDTLALYEFLLRKTAHFTLYAVFGCGLAGLFLRQRRIPAFCGAVPAAAAWAALDEFHQSLVSDRLASVRDVVLDTCGAAAGCALILLCAFLFRRHERGKKT